MIEPLVLEKRNNNLFDIMRDNQMRPQYSPPKIILQNIKSNKIYSLNNTEERDLLQKEFNINDEIYIKFYNDADFIEEILCKNLNQQNKFSIATWEKCNNYIWDSSDDNVEMEGWLINNLMRFNFGLVTFTLPNELK